VWYYLQSVHGTRAARDVGSAGFRAKEARRKADYETRVEALADVMADCLDDAQLVLEALGASV
jgi:hypothetical protein